MSPRKAKPTKGEIIGRLGPLLGPVMNERWRDENYACLGVDPDLFFPKTKEVHEAVAICNTCDVQLDCLNANLDEEYGVFGGTSQHERRVLRDWLEQRANG